MLVFEQELRDPGLRDSTTVVECIETEKDSASCPAARIICAILDVILCARAGSVFLQFDRIV